MELNIVEDVMSKNPILIGSIYCIISNVDTTPMKACVEQSKIYHSNCKHPWNLEPKSLEQNYSHIHFPIQGLCTYQSREHLRLGTDYQGEHTSGN